MVETLAERALPPRWWWWYAGVVLAFALAGVLIGVTNIIANNRQDAEAAAANKARDEQAAALVECLNRYSVQTETRSNVLGDATEVRDAATERRDDALNAEGNAFLHFVQLLVDGKADGPEDIQPLLDSLKKRATTSRALDRAQALLDQAREDYPVPKAPSPETCALPGDGS